MARGRLIEYLLVACICFAPAESIRSNRLDASESYFEGGLQNDSCLECGPVLDRFVFAVQQCSTDAYQPGPYIILENVQAKARPSAESRELSYVVKRGTEIQVTSVTSDAANVWGEIDQTGASQPEQGPQQKAWILLTTKAGENKAAMFPSVGWYRLLPGDAVLLTGDLDGQEAIARLQPDTRVQVTGQPIMGGNGKVRAPIGPYRAHRGVLLAGMPTGYITILDAAQGQWYAKAEFESYRNGSPWLNVLARHGTARLQTDLAHEMEHRLRSPEFVIDQGAYGFCGMAAVSFMQALAYPVQYGEMMQNLFCTGKWTNTMGYSVETGYSVLDYVKKAFTLGGNTSDIYQAGINESMQSLDWIAMTSLGNVGDALTGLVHLQSSAQSGGSHDFQMWRFLAAVFGGSALHWVVADYLQGWKPILDPNAPSQESWAPLVAAASEPSKMIIIGMFSGSIGATKEALKQWRMTNHYVVLVKSYQYTAKDSTQKHACIIWTWARMYRLDCDVLRRLSRQGTQVDIVRTEIAEPLPETPVGPARSGLEQPVEFSVNTERLALFKQQLGGSTLPVFSWRVTGMESEDG